MVKAFNVRMFFFKSDDGDSAYMIHKTAQFQTDPAMLILVNQGTTIGFSLCKATGLDAILSLRVQNLKGTDSVSKNTLCTPSSSLAGAAATGDLASFFNALQAGDTSISAANTTLPVGQYTPITICQVCSMDHAKMACKKCSARFHTSCYFQCCGLPEIELMLLCDLCCEEQEKDFCTRRRALHERSDWTCFSCNQPGCLVASSISSCSAVKQQTDEEAGLADKSNKVECVDCFECGRLYCHECICMWKGNGKKKNCWKCFACIGIKNHDKNIAQMMTKVASQVMHVMKLYLNKTNIPQYAQNLWDQFARIMLYLQDGCCFSIFQNHLPLLMKLSKFQLTKKYKTNLIPSIVPYQLSSILGMHKMATADMLRKVSAAYAHQASKSAGTSLPISTRVLGEQQMKIAYGSSDLRFHALWHLFREALLLHSKTFQIHLYSKPPIGENVLQDMMDADIDFVVIDYPSTDLDSKKAVAQFVVVNFPQNTCSQDIALQLRKDIIDIYVDLNGHTAQNFIGVSALRGACAHLAFLGYPGSIEGCVDFVVADPNVLKGSQLDEMQEKVIMLRCCQPNSMRTLHFEMLDGPYSDLMIRHSRLKLGLPSHGFLFAYLGRLGRLTPDIVKCWGEILKQTPGSFIVLRKHPLLAVPRVKELILSLGIDLKRFVFVPSLSTHLYLMVLSECDVVLDSRHYSLHTCCSDSLGVGTPVVALMEKNACWPGLVSGSLVLNAMGNDDLIANTMEEYVLKAVNLFSHPETLNRLRAQLKQAREQGTGIFNSHGFIHSLEAAFQIIMDRHCSGMPFENIDLSSSS